LQNWSLVTDALLPAFFTAIALFLVYIARDFDKKLSSFQKDKLEVYRAIRERIKGQNFYSALADIIKIVHIKHLKGFDGVNEELSDEITRILHSTDSWRTTKDALSKIEDSAKQILAVDSVWAERLSSGSKVKDLLYVFAFLCLVVVPVIWLDLFYVWIIWILTILITLALVALYYRGFASLDKAFQKLEYDFYVKV